MKFFYFLLILALVLVAGTGNLVFAVTEKTTGGNLTAEFSPATPEPGKKVTVKLKSFQLDLMTAPIEWLIDEKSVAQGIGLSEYTLTVGPLGEIRSLVVRVTKADGGKIIKTITYQPATLDLIYSTDSYVPPFYRGHSLPSPGSKVKVTALPTITNEAGKNIPANKLVYEWRVGGEKIVKASGVGKSSATIRLGDLYEESLILVTVSDSLTGTSIEKKITIKTTEPRIAFYRSDPLLGVLYNRTLGADYTMTGSEETFRAEPYFFSATDWASDNLNFQWLVDNKPAEISEGDRRLLTIARPEGVNNTAGISLRVENKNNLFQNSNNGFRLKY